MRYAHFGPHEPNRKIRVNDCFRLVKWAGVRLSTIVVAYFGPKYWAEITVLLTHVFEVDQKYFFLPFKCFCLF